jgi:hypothetical protein
MLALEGAERSYEPLGQQSGAGGPRLVSPRVYGPLRASARRRRTGRYRTWWKGGGRDCDREGGYHAVPMPPGSRRVSSPLAICPSASQRSRLRGTTTSSGTSRSSTRRPRRSSPRPIDLIIQPSLPTRAWLARSGPFEIGSLGAGRGAGLLSAEGCHAVLAVQASRGGSRSQARVARPGQLRCGVSPGRRAIPPQSRLQRSRP